MGATGIGGPDEGHAPEPAGGLSFDRAEYTSESRSEGTCCVCQKSIAETYFTVNERVACPPCREALQEAMTSGSGLARFLRATVLGLIAAAMGAGLYYGVLALTGYEIGLIALIVGLMVGTAVRTGANGRGGWLYQALAIFLTYGSIVSTYVPLILREIFKDEPAGTASPAPRPTMAPRGDPRKASHGPMHGAPASPPAPTHDASTSPRGPAQGVSASTRNLGPSQPSLWSFVLGWLLLFGFAFTLPFLMLLGGGGDFMGLVIIGFALYEAWSLNRKMVLVTQGPFRLVSRPSPQGTSAA